MKGQTHPVDRLSDDELRDLILRVSADSFPGDIEQLWQIERVRYRETLRRIPPAASEDATLLDLGSSRYWLAGLQVVLGYRRIVLNTMYPESGFVNDGLTVRGYAPADVRMSVFNVERDRFPHADESFDVVLCMELLEHLAVDPMAMMAEVNRVLKPGGFFLLSTPNAVRYSNCVKMILGEQPQGWSPYNGCDSNRHNREYSPAEVKLLLSAGGIRPDVVTTVGNKSRGWQRDLLKRAVSVALSPVDRFSSGWRRDTILSAGRKSTSRIDRRPPWLYFDLAERAPSSVQLRHSAG